jgi:talin
MQNNNLDLNNNNKILIQTKLLAQSTTELVNSLKQEAIKETCTNEQQRKLLQSAKQLAEATSKMVDYAKQCASNPNDNILKKSLLNAANNLNKQHIIPFIIILNHHQ